MRAVERVSSKRGYHNRCTVVHNNRQGYPQMLDAARSRGIIIVGPEAWAAAQVFTFSGLFRFGLFWIWPLFDSARKRRPGSWHHGVSLWCAEGWSSSHAIATSTR